MSRIPILVTGYNRPKLMNDLLDYLHKIGISNLFVALDGPRNNYDAASCLETHKVVQKYKEFFDMSIMTRPNNLGCCLGVVSALDWFFSQTEFGIVIEDDCLPKKEFFSFAIPENLNTNLDISRRLGMISAHNPFDFNFSDNTTNSILIHGWATSSDIWKEIRKNYFKFKLPSRKNNLGATRPISTAMFWWSNANRAKLGLVDTWDGIFADNFWRLGFFTLIPNINMVKNLGYGDLGTHTKNSKEDNQVTIGSEELQGETLDYLLDQYYFKIRKRHIISTPLRMILDILKCHKRPNFEEILTQDLSERVIEFSSKSPK
jgi:hypothetical protein